jgi:hypothetical protein
MTSVKVLISPLKNPIRIGSLLKVVHTRTPKTTYAVSATTNFRLSPKLLLTFARSIRAFKNPGAQGWIRTTERRKGGQIYSLLALTAHPPVHAYDPQRTGGLNLASCLRTNQIPPRQSQTKARKQTPALEHPIPEAYWGSLENFLGLPITADHQSSRRARVAFATWSWRRDLNPRPSDYKSDALPTELRQQNLPASRDKVQRLAQRQLALQAHNLVFGQFSGKILLRPSLLQKGTRLNATTQSQKAPHPHTTAGTTQFCECYDS